MRVAAIFVNYRTAELTLKAVSALLEQLTSLGSHHVFVVDNDSKDGSFEHLSRGVAELGLGERVSVLAAPRNGGYGYGINYAIKVAQERGHRPEYFYVLNTDAFASPGALQRLVDFGDEHPKAGLVGSCIVNMDGSGGVAGFRFPSVIGELEGSARLGFLSNLFRSYVVPVLPVPDVDTEVDWVPGTSMLIRGAVAEAGVLFDERFFLYFEEIDFARQVLEAGWQVFTVAGAPIMHEGSVSTGLDDEKKPWPDYWFDSRAFYFNKHHGPGYALACDVACAIGTGVHFAKCKVLGKPYAERPKMVSGMVRANIRRLREVQRAWLS